MKFIKKNINFFVKIIIILLLFLMLFNLNFVRKKIISILGGYTDIKTTIVIDTFITKEKIDTLKFINKYIKTKGKLVHYDTITNYVYINNNNETITETVKKFNVEIEDSLISGNFLIFNNFKGDLLNSDFTYKPKFPKYIIKEKEKIITKTITNTLTKEENKIGIGFMLNTENNGFIKINYLTKKDLDFGINIGKSFNNLNNNKLIIGFSFTKYF